MWLASQPGGMGSAQARQAKADVPTASARTPQRKLIPNERMSTPPGTLTGHLQRHGHRCRAATRHVKYTTRAHAPAKWPPVRRQEHAPNEEVEGSDRDEDAVHRRDRLRPASGDADGAGAAALS